jgi:hypothetical protein
MWYINTMECYKTLNKKEIQSFVTAWIKLKDNILSEISQAPKDKYCMMSLLYVESKNIKPLKAESRMVVSRGWEVGEVWRMRTCCVKGTKFQLDKRSKF